MPTFFFHKSGISIEELETIEKHFYAVYLADVPDRKKLKESDRMVVGKGIIDFERIFRIIKECNYKGVYTVKLYSDCKTKNKSKNILKSAREHLVSYLDMLEYL